MKSLHTLALAAGLAAAATGGVLADTTTLNAVPQVLPGQVYGATAQVDANGPGNSQKYMDVRGSGNGSTFGVIDFNGDGIPLAGDANKNPEIVNFVSPSISLGLTDASFDETNPGTLDFFLADNNTPLYNLAYDATDTSRTAGVGSQLGNLYFLGSFAYTSTSPAAAGTLDTYNLTLPGGAALDYFRQQLNAGGNIRFVLTDPNADSEVAGFQGATGSSAPPTLTFTAAVPEANTPMLLLVGLLGLSVMGIARRRKSA